MDFKRGRICGNQQYLQIGHCWFYRGPSQHVVFNSGAGTATVNLTLNSTTAPTKNVTVITISNTVSPSSQSVSYGSSATITGGAPGSGCSPSYSFWWETAATSGGSYSTISGATGQNLTVNPVTQTAYYRRALSFNGDIIYTPEASISIPALSVGSISTSSSTVSYNSQPSISQTAGSGGFLQQPYL